MCLTAAGLCIIFFLIFMTGYVWGKRVALEDVLKAIEQKTFADQISGSLYALSCARDIKKEEPLEQEAVVINMAENQLPESEEAVSKEEPQDEAFQAIESAKEQPSMIEIINVQENPSDVSQSDRRDNHCYYAQLIGFGSKKAAEQFVARLKTCDAQGIVRERTSTGAHGKKKFGTKLLHRSIQIKRS